MNEIAGAGSRGSTTPSAYVDRGALSEAWYRALYGTRDVARPEAASRAIEAAGRAPAGTARVAVPSARAADVACGRRTLASGARGARTVAIVRADRARPDLATRMTAAPRVAGRPAVCRTTVALTLPDGRDVDVLVQRRGRRVHVIALADRRSSAAVGAALERARIALAALGLRVDVDSRQKGTS